MSDASAARPAPARLIALIAIAVLLVAAAVADRHRPKAPARVATARTAGMPVAPPASALNASWYCPGAGANNGLTIRATRNGYFSAGWTHLLTTVAP